MDATPAPLPLCGPLSERDLAGAGIDIGVVMTERVDVFKLPDKSFELPVMGTFELSDGKINAWRDYFDLNQFTSQMP
jgi:limonene-1,2-epoxide hydrolase